MRDSIRFAGNSAAALTFALGLFVGHGSAADAPPHAPGEVAESYQRPIVIRIRGAITFATEQFLRRQLETAKNERADLVIVDIDSPGGEAQASMDISQAFANVDWARTLAYVEEEAISGAAFIALGCDDIVLRPSALIGDAGPIVLGEDSLFRHAPEKIISILSAKIGTIAASKGHPRAIAEAMVDRHLAVYFYRNANTGDQRAMSEREFAELDDKKDWIQDGLVPGSREDQFLTLNGEQALAVGLAAANVDNFAELKELYGLTTEPKVFEETWVDTLVLVLNSPLVTGILLVVALVCLYLELYTAGLGLFGLLSGLCFALFFWSRFLGGTSGWLEVILFLAGVACIAVELFLLPGFGVFGLTGILLMLAGLILASAHLGGPFVDQFDSIASSGATVVGALAGFLVVSLVLGRFLGALPIFRRMALTPPVVDGAMADAALAEGVGVASFSHLLDAIGTSRTPLRPAGKMRIDDHDYDVVAEGAFIGAAKTVRVVLVQGNRIVVREEEE